MRVLVLTVLCTSSIFCALNSAPREIIEKITQLNMLYNAILDNVFEIDSVRSILSQTKTPTFFDQLKQVIGFQLKIGQMNLDNRNNFHLALKILDIPPESIILFSTIKNQPEAEKLINGYKGAVPPLIKDHIDRLSILKKVKPQELIHDLRIFINSIGRIPYEPIIEQIENITGTSKNDYIKFIDAVKDGLSVLIEKKIPPETRKPSKRALDRYFIITRVFFVRTMCYKNKLKKNNEIIDKAKFGSEFLGTLKSLANRQIQMIPEDLSKPTLE